MKALIILAGTAFILSGCMTSETQLKETLKKNPKIIFDVIEENPEQFIDAVNRAAQKAQQKQYERQISKMHEEQENDIKNPRKPKLTDNRRLMGTSGSSITIVEYADFQCPACRMAYQSLNQFKKKYKGRVQFYYKHMPLDFHPMAYPAALYFEAIKNQDIAKARKFYELVFENQIQMSDETSLKKWARAAGADIIKIQRDIKSEKIKQIIEEDMVEFQKFGFTGTPVILVNGVALHGAQKIEELERIVRLTGGL